MQTFMPYPDFGETVRCLDYRRLGKQRVEAMQLLNILLGKTPNSRWRNHPACKMWKGRHEALALYMNYCINEWISRGYNNSMEIWTNWTEKTIIMPTWFGDEQFHASHRSNLLRKKPDYYGKFGWTEPNDLEYVWPTEGYSSSSWKLNIAEKLK